jgi:uncharacterized repeat protein (TIGR01451 family)
MPRATGRVIEALEDRTLFAWNLAIGLTPTNGVSTSTSGNTVTYAAVATGATLDWSDVTGSLAAGHSVVISSGTTGIQAGNITDNTGVQTGPIPPNLNLTFETGSVTGLTGTISVENVLLDGSNASITINANGGVSIGMLSAGTSLNPAPLATVLITSKNDSIFPRTNPDIEPIVATTLALKASRGITRSSTPLLTQVADLSAQTTTGGMAINNTGNVNINGGMLSGVNGLRSGAEGEISLVDQGSISLINEQVITPDPINLAALGPNSDIQVASEGEVSGDEGVTVHADRDVLVSDGSVISSDRGTASVTAGRDVILNNSAQITTDFGQIANITVSAGRNLTIESTSGTNNTLIGSSGGSINLATGPGGIFTLDAGAGGQVSNFSPLSPGNITISSDDMVIDDPIYDGKNTVTLQQAGTTARNIDLGLGTTPGELDLSNATISQITAQSLQIGRADNPGNIVLTAAVTPSLLGYGAPGTLELLSGGSISAAAPGDTLTVPNLALQASSGIGTRSEPLETAVSVLSAAAATGGIYIDNSGNLSIGGGVLPKVTGLKTSGDIQLQNTGSITLLAGDDIAGPNNVSVAAIGASSDIQTGGNGTSGVQTIETGAGGTVTVTAGRDLLVGSGSLSAGAIEGGNVVLNAGRDLIVNGGSSVHGVHSVTAAVGRNLTVSTPKDEILSDASPITLTTGDGGVLTDNGSISSAVAIAGGIITLTAAEMAIAGSVTAATSTITLDVTGSGVVTGTISAFGLQKTGAGSLLVDGPTGAIAAPTTVDAGTLGGTGTVRLITAEPGATLAPGDNAPGILTTERDTLSSGSTFSVQLGGPTPGNTATNYGQLDASGNVTLNNATLAANLTYVPALSQTFTLIQATGNISGQFAQGMFVVLNGITYSINYLQHSVVLAAQADLSVSVSGPTSAIEGSTASYAYTVSDSGPGAAQNIVLSAPIPAGAVFVSASFGGAFSMLPASAYNASTGTADLGVLPAGTGGTLTLNVRLPEENPGIAWSATVASTTNDPNLANNAFSITTVVNDAPLAAQGHEVSSSLGAKTFTNVAVATFTDANPAATASDFTATVNWGDGTVGPAQIVRNTNGTFSVIASHTYKDSKISSYSLTIQIIDVGGSTATVTGKALLRPVSRP